MTSRPSRVYAVVCMECGAHGPISENDAESKKAYEAVAIDWSRRAADWQPIETAPKDGRLVLITGGTIRAADMEMKPSALNYAIPAEMDWGEWTHYGEHGEEWIIENPTHWTPLPEPPKEGDE